MKCNYSFYPREITLDIHFRKFLFIFILLELLSSDLPSIINIFKFNNSKLSVSDEITDKLILILESEFLLVVSILFYSP